MKRMKMRRNIARAIAGPDLPSRREVEDHKLTHIPLSKLVQPLHERRTEERTQKEVR